MRKTQTWPIRTEIMSRAYNNYQPWRVKSNTGFLRDTWSRPTTSFQTAARAASQSKRKTLEGEHHAVRRLLHTWAHRLSSVAVIERGKSVCHPCHSERTTHFGWLWHRQLFLAAPQLPFLRITHFVYNSKAIPIIIPWISVHCFVPEMSGNVRWRTGAIQTISMRSLTNPSFLHKETQWRCAVGCLAVGDLCWGAVLRQQSVGEHEWWSGPGAGVLSSPRAQCWRLAGV